MTARSLGSWALFASLTLAACGGGGGVIGNTTPPRYILELKFSGQYGWVRYGWVEGNFGCYDMGEGNTCHESLLAGTVATLTAYGTYDSFFVSWSGCDSTAVNPQGLGGEDCTVTMNADRSVTATFLQGQYLDVAKAGSGGGKVHSDWSVSVPGATGSSELSGAVDCGWPWPEQDGQTCRSLVPPNAALTLTATPDDTSTFGGWSGCDSSDGETCTVGTSATQSREVTVTFNHYTLAVQKTGSGSGTVRGGRTIDCGSICSEPDPVGAVVTLVALPDATSIVGSWTGCDSSSGPNCSVTMNRDRAVTVAFEPFPYTVTYVGNGNAGGSPPVDETHYLQGQTVTVLGNTGNLFRTDSYSFAGWNTQADGSGTTYTPGQTFTMGSSSVTLYARWTANPTWTVTYDGNGNTGGTVPVDNTNYRPGQTVIVLGNTGNLSRIGYSFAGWNTQANGSGTTYTPGQSFTMGSSNVTLHARWTAQPTYIVRYSGNDNTGGNPPVDDTHYLQGQTVTVLGNTGNLTNTGYTFGGWSTDSGGGGVVYQAGNTFTMGSADVWLYADWISTSHTLSVVVQGAGTVTSSPGNIACPNVCSWPFVAGTSVTLTATPAQGGQFLSWGGACAGVTGPVCTLGMANSDRQATATFKQLACTLSVPGSCSPGYIFCTSVCCPSSTPYCSPGAFCHPTADSGRRPAARRASPAGEGRRLSGISLR